MLWSAPSTAVGPDASVLSAWAGAVTDTTFTAKHYLSADTAGAKLAVSVNSDMSSPVYSARADSVLRCVRHTITGLTADTDYYFCLQVNGSVLSTKKGRFRTMPAGTNISFRFASVGCQSGQNNGKTLDQLRALSPKPQFALWNGDMYYDDISENSEILFDQAKERVLGGTYSGPFLREVPTYYMHDDHDYGPNDSDSTNPAREASLAVFRRRAPNPAGAFTGMLEPVCFSFVQGRVRFVLTDMRSQKTASTVLDTAQKAWLASEFAAAYSAGQFVCWFSTAPWTGGGWSDGWNGSSAKEDERAEVATMIVNAGMGARTFIIAGDAHAIQIDDGSNGHYATGGGLRAPCITSTPLYAGVGLAIGAPFSYGAGITTKTSQSGYFDITDGGGDITVAFTGIGMNDADGSPTTLASYSFTLPVASPALPSSMTLVQEWHTWFTNSGTSYSSTLRAAPVSGNLLLMRAVVKGNTVGSLGVPAGWNKIGSDQNTTGALSAAYYKYAGASEPQTIAFTTSGARFCAVSILEISGAHPSSPIGQDVVDTQDPTAVHQVSMAFTPGTANEWALAFASIENGGNITGARTWSAGFVERAYPNPLHQPGYSMASKQLGASGVADTATFSFTGTDDQMHGRVITIKAA